MSAWTRDHFRPEDEAGDSKGGKADKKHSKSKGDTKPQGKDETPADGSETARSASGDDADTSGLPANNTSTASVAAAEALFESGHEAMSQGDYDTACARFLESHRLDPAVGALLNLAVCEEKRGRLATAWQLFKRVMNELPAGDDRYPIAQRHASDLRPRVPHLSLILEPGAPKSTVVKYDDAVLGPASFRVPLPFDPGEHTLNVVAPGREARSYQITLHEGDKKQLKVGPGDPK